MSRGAAARVGTGAATGLTSPRTKRKQQAARAWRATLLATTPEAEFASGWFDGSAQPNPGRIGLGAVLVTQRGQRVELSLASGVGDSNVAEYLALIGLLELAHQQRVRRLIVHGDTQIVLQDVAATAPAPIAALQAYRQRAQHLLQRFDEVRFCWLPRERNQVADALARTARQSATSMPE